MLRQITAIAGAALLFALPASAQERIDVETNKAHLIQLDENADVVLIANPEIADVVVESPRTIFLLGKQPGETSLFILGVGGKDIIRSAVVVTAGAAGAATPEEETAGPKVIELYRSPTPEIIVLPQ